MRNRTLRRWRVRVTGRGVKLSGAEAKAEWRRVCVPAVRRMFRPDINRCPAHTLDPRTPAYLIPHLSMEG